MTTLSMKAQVQAALPGTVAQIIAKSGVKRATVYRWITELRKEGACYIKGWRRTAGLLAPYFAAGPGIDANKPPRRTGAEYSHRHYVKHRREPEKELRAVRKLARLNAAQMAKRPQSWLSALGVQ